MCQSAIQTMSSGFGQDGQEGFSCSFRHWVKFKIVVHFRSLLFVHSPLPVDLHPDPERAPPHPGQRGRLVASDGDGDQSGVEGGMQFELDAADGLAERWLAGDWPHVDCPPVLVVLVGLQHFCGVADQQPHHDSLADDLLLLQQGLGVECGQGCLEFVVGVEVVGGEGGAAEGAAEVAGDDGCFGEAVEAEGVAAGVEADGLEEHSQADGAAMVLVNTLPTLHSIDIQSATLSPIYLSF